MFLTSPKHRAETELFGSRPQPSKHSLLGPRGRRRNKRLHTICVRPGIDRHPLLSFQWLEFNHVTSLSWEGSCLVWLPESRGCVVELNGPDSSWLSCFLWRVFLAFSGLSLAVCVTLKSFFLSLNYVEIHTNIYGRNTPKLVSPTYW